MDFSEYRFEKVWQCEMCKSDASQHKILGQRLNTSQGIHPKKKEGISVSIKKCSVCGLIYASPIPIPTNIQDHYGVPPETYWYPNYFNWTPDYFSAELDILKKRLAAQREPRALDIGAGIGKCMLSLKNAGFDTYGLEPSEPFYARAISEMQIQPEKLKLGMIESVEYEDSYFDFITYGAVFEHLYHPAEVLEKTIRWLKPGGIVHIEVPSADHLIPKFINLYYRLRGTNYVTNLSPMHEPFHLYEFTLKSFEAAVKKISCSIIFHQYKVGSIYVFPKLVHPVLRKYMERKNQGMQLTVWLQKQ